jgi:hypothetical protein
MELPSFLTGQLHERFTLLRVAAESSFMQNERNPHTELPSFLTGQIQERFTLLRSRVAAESSISALFSLSLTHGHKNMFLRVTQVCFRVPPICTLFTQGLLAVCKQTESRTHPYVGEGDYKHQACKIPGRLLAENHCGAHNA